MPIYERRLSFLPDWFPFQLRRLKKSDWVYRDGEITEGKIQWEAVLTSPTTVKIKSKFPQVRFTPAQETEKVLVDEEINTKGPDFLVWEKEKPSVRQRISDFLSSQQYFDAAGHS